MPKPISTAEERAVYELAQRGYNFDRIALMLCRNVDTVKEAFAAHCRRHRITRKAFKAGLPLPSDFRPVPLRTEPFDRRTGHRVPRTKKEAKLELDRQVFSMREEYGYTFLQLAEILRMSRGKVTRCYYREAARRGHEVPASFLKQARAAASSVRITEEQRYMALALREDYRLDWSDMARCMGLPVPAARRAYDEAVERGLEVN